MLVSLNGSTRLDTGSSVDLEKLSNATSRGQCWYLVFEFHVKHELTHRCSHHRTYELIDPSAGDQLDRVDTVILIPKPKFLAWTALAIRSCLRPESWKPLKDFRCFYRVS
jgi:hypothetical protein